MKLFDIILDYFELCEILDSEYEAMVKDKNLNMAITYHKYKAKMDKTDNDKQ